jgi:Domain of unknown function (DUF4157)
MGWLTNGLKNLGVGGDVIKVVEAVDNGVGEAAKAAQDIGVHAAEATVKAAIAPTTVAIALTKGDLKAVEDTISNLVRETADTATATAKLASTPYFVAADITRDVGGDGIKLIRGGINGRLVEINVVPIILRKLGRLDAKTPEEIAKTIATAPLEILLAAHLQAALDILEPAAKVIPKSIKKLLRDHFDGSLLDKAKYHVSSVGFTLPEAINGTMVFMGEHAFAVTVGNVIIFSLEPDNSDSAVRWWAHELCHVVQYERWGVDGFAERYVKNFAEIEQEAESKADEVIKAL